MQKNWIKKKEWIDIDYKIDGANKKITVSTTRPETNFGATFVVMAPEHPILLEQSNLISEEKRKKINKYIEEAKKKTAEERVDEKNKKTGVFTGLYCINELTNKKMPIYVTDFVLMDVGTGVVVGVPGHDKRDFEFAKKFDLPIVRVVVGKDKDNSLILKKSQVQEEEGTMINSGFLNGLDIPKATKKMMDYLEKKKMGKRTTRYRLKDWLVSRQRFWGTPIPIIYCEKCGVVPVPEKDLPVILPEKIKFQSESNPLLDYSPFVNVKCPKCGKNAKRENDTMDTFVNSSWYFLRYCDSENNKEIFDKKKVESWMPVDVYIGGAEHACMHLIYCRFYTKFLRDLGLLKIDEPIKKLFNQGMVHGKDGFVMSKSKGNGINPLEVAEKYGVDVLSFFLVSNANPDKDFSWNENSIEGSFKFINRILRYFENLDFKVSSKKFESKLNSAIKLITKYIDEMKYNLAIIEIRSLFEFLFLEKISKKDTMSCLKLLHPFCPHITEELWEKIGQKKFISLESWPKADEKKIDKNLEQQEKSVELLIEDINHLLKLINKKVNKCFIYTLPNEKNIYLEERKLIEKRCGLNVEIYAVNDKDKYNPQDKAKKAKPNKPAIYLE